MGERELTKDWNWVEGNAAIFPRVVLFCALKTVRFRKTFESRSLSGKSRLTGQNPLHFKDGRKKSQNTWFETEETTKKARCHET